MIGGYIEFIDGSSRFILNEMYSNSAKLNYHLRRKLIDKELGSMRISKKSDVTPVQETKSRIYKGDPIFSLRGILLWIALVLVLILVLTEKISIEGIVLYMIGWGGLLIIFSWTMYFAELSADFLIIKHHTGIWKQRTYRRKDIQEVVFKRANRASYSMTIITKDFRSKTFPASTLSDSTWLALKNHLEELGIPVDDRIGVSLLPKL